MTSSSSYTDRIRRGAGRPIGDPTIVEMTQKWWTLLLRGIIAILFGIAAIVMPGPTMLSLIYIWAAFTLIDGLFAIISGATAAWRRDRWGLLVLEGIVDIAAGAVALLWPGLTAFAFVMVIAAWAMVSGVLMLAAAFRLGQHHGRGWLVFGAVLSIVFSIALFGAPLAGMVVLTWWIGVYAVIFGTILMILSFKFRGLRDDWGVRMGIEAR